MQTVSEAPDIASRPQSRGTVTYSTMRQSVPLQDVPRSRSNTGPSVNRPKSRASTTSLHSATTVDNEASQPGHARTNSSQTGQQIYAQNHGGMMIGQGSFEHQQQQQAPPQHSQPHVQGPPRYSINPHIGGSHPQHMQQQAAYSFDSQHMDQSSFGHQNHDPFAIQQQYASGHQHRGSISMSYQDFDGLDNDSTAMDDSELLDAKKKRPSSSTQQNEIELKRLLEQYQGKSLKEVAVEIQKTDSTGGKSEKVKQVFAMLWLRENCEKSGRSVRRDRVFSCYAKRCGNEAVPTLNPASFGKLVRIIFSDVKTRRLGVRGESKYHYVDLSLIPEIEREAEELGDDFGFKPNTEFGASQMRRSQSFQRVLQTPTDTAEFPAPSMQPAPEQQESPFEILKPSPPTSYNKMMECRYLGQPLIPINTSTLAQAVSEKLNKQLPKTSSGVPYLLTYLAHPPQAPTLSSPEEQIELPDIHVYLRGEAYDTSIADSLTNLYRSYCICLIDAFRYCKEKQFFHHHSAFNGNMTVPVQKLLSHERLASWIHECDIRMYKRMIGFVAGLTTQVVPKAVLDTFDRICTKLISHLSESFEKMPAHVVAAKVVPATRFVHLLSKLPKVNHMAQTTHALLQTPSSRTQMWLDLLQMTDPHALIEESHFTADALPAAENLLRYEYKALLTPLEESLASQFEDNNIAWTSFLRTASTPSAHAIASINDPSDLMSSSHLDRWIQHLTSLHLQFPAHTPKCIINHHTSLWKAILTELGVNGASTYQCWWQLDIFLSAMMSWLTELAGFGDPEVQEEQDRIEAEKNKEDEERNRAWCEYKKKKAEWDTWMSRGQSSPRHAQQHASHRSDQQDQQGTKRKRDEFDAGSHQQKRRGTSTASTSTKDDGQTLATSAPTSRPPTSRANVSFDGAADQHESDTIPLIPSLDLTTTPAKNTRSKTAAAAAASSGGHGHDDSGIGLDINIEDDLLGLPTGSSPALKFGLTPARKGAKDTWPGLLASDPADAAGDVVVV